MSVLVVDDEMKIKEKQQKNINIFTDVNMSPLVLDTLKGAR